LIFARFKTRTQPDARKNLKGPLLTVLELAEKLLQPGGRATLAMASGLTELKLPDLHPWVVREGLLNALVHRDYFLAQSIHVHLHDDKLEISSPGGFVGGVSPDNILRHVPRRRNPFLADTLEKIGYVNRLGMGVDRIYEELLKLGKRTPIYLTDESSVTLMIPMTSNPAFARFVAEEFRADRKLDLDDLICLRTLSLEGHIDRWRAARALQLQEEQAAQRLTSLRARRYLLAHGRGRGAGYRLVRKLSDALRGQEATDDELPLDEEAVRLRIQAVLKERGKLTNMEVRRISGYHRIQALRLMHAIIKEGAAKLVGRGRAAHYVSTRKAGK
jgi:ATP-dependent DNA helicase RecG